MNAEISFRQKATFLIAAVAKAILIGALGFLMIKSLRYFLIEYLSLPIPGALFSLLLAVLIGAIAGYAMQSYGKALRKGVKE